MESFSEVTPLWDISNPDLMHLGDQDFFALFQKQFAPLPGNGVANGFPTYPDGVNPQNLSTYSLPSLTPPSTSEDSSPSPPNSNQDAGGDDNQDSALKRKASDDELSEGPSHKTQHTDKRTGAAGATGPRRKNKDEQRLMKRKEQNRAAQRAFRERKEKHVKDLEDKVAELEAKNQEAVNENENLRDLLGRLQSENMTLKQSTFTFAVPKSASTTATENALTAASPAASVASSSGGSHVPPKTTNPLDWSSLTTFDPNVLNLLDDNVSQPTATDNAMQMNFGFGGQLGISSNAPFTTIASNPMFMSFASAFDGQTPPSDGSSPAGSTPAPSGNNFDFDMNSLTSWPTSNSNSQDPVFDDLFSSYLSSVNGSTDFATFSGTPSSISPVTHHTSPPDLRAGASPMASGSSSSSPSVLGTGPLFTSPATPSEAIDIDSAASCGPGKCPKTKAQMSDSIAKSGDSPFAPPIQKSTDNVMGTMIKCTGSKFPKTAKSDHNVEVLAAWRSIRADPQFKDVDINDLCEQFTSKARCDGTKVVLEPSGVNQILDTLSKKKSQ